LADLDLSKKQMWEPTEFGEGKEYDFFWERFRQIVREEIAAALQVFVNPQAPQPAAGGKEIHVGMKELCLGA
jgi:hypothetical protein